MKRNTKLIGCVSELTVMAALAYRGYRILIPYGDSARYDVVLEDSDGTFTRVQIKTGRLRKGAIEFNAYSSHTHRGGASTRTYVGDVDFFGVFCPQVGRCYLVPAHEICTHGSLRVDGTRNGQAKRVRWATKYELQMPAQEVVGGKPVNVVPFPGLMPL
jgi:hypothetical protein